MAREARRRCRCGEGRGKDVGLDRREEDAGARGAEKMSGRERREEDADAGAGDSSKRGKKVLRKKVPYFSTICNKKIFNIYNHIALYLFAYI